MTPGWSRSRSATVTGVTDFGAREVLDGCAGKVGARLASAGGNPSVAATPV